MKHIGIRKFRANISHWLKKLPIILTSNGKPVARVEEINGKDGDTCDCDKEDTQ